MSLQVNQPSNIRKATALPNEESPSSPKRPKVDSVVSSLFQGAVPLISAAAAAPLSHYFPQTPPHMPPSPRRAPPPAPRRGRGPATHLSPYQLVSTPSNWIGTGDYCHAYKQGNLVEKRFHNRRLQTDKQLLTALSFMLFEYIQLKAKNFPIATFHTFDQLINGATLTTRQACKDLLEQNPAARTLISEYIPHPFPKCQNELPDVNSKEYQYYVQVQKMFSDLFEWGIAADLKNDNLRIDDQGKVIYIDPLPIEEEDGIAVLLNSLLKTFGAPESEVYRFLDPRESHESGIASI